MQMKWKYMLATSINVVERGIHQSTNHPDDADMQSLPNVIAWFMGV